MFLLCACIKYSPIIAIWYKSHLQSKRVSLYNNKTKVNVYKFIKKIHIKNKGNEVVDNPVNIPRPQ